MSTNKTRSPAGKWVAQLLLLALALAAGLAAAECAVRLLYPEYGVPIRKVHLFTEFDPLLGWRKVPGFRGTCAQDEYSTILRYNSRGLRGPEYAYEKSADEYRILVLGDSFAEGYSVEFEDLFSEVMKEALNRELDRPVEVINAGTGGYSTDQELLFFQAEGKKYRPDLTVLLIYHNDITYNVRADYPLLERGGKPLFELKDGQPVLKSVPPPPDGPEASSRAPHARVFHLRDPGSWYLARLLGHVRRVWSYRHEMAGHPPLELALEEALAEDGAPAGAGDTDSPREAWEMTEALLRKLEGECADVSSELLLFFVPHRTEIYTRQNEVWDGASSVGGMLADIAARNGLELIDPLPLFRARARELGPRVRRLYWKGDSHWTPEGNQLTGHILARHILQNRERYGL